MAFILGMQTEKENCTRLDLHFDKTTMEKVESSEFDESIHGVMTFWLQSLTGRDKVRIDDQMMKGEKRGGTRMLAGTVSKLRVIASVFEIEGMEQPNGDAVTKLTSAGYDILKDWACEALLAKVNELSSISEEEAGNSEPPSATD